MVFLDAAHLLEFLLGLSKAPIASTSSNPAGLDQEAHIEALGIPRTLFIGGC